MNAKSGKNHTVNHFFEKLIKLADLMQTKRGQEMALKRKLTMLSFLEDFFAEQCLQNWLALLKQTQN
jgi:uncharacterized protein